MALKYGDLPEHVDLSGLDAYHPDHTEKDAAQARILAALAEGEKPDQEDVSTAVGESFRTLYDLGKLHLAGDRLYVLSFRGNPGFIPYVKVGITKDSNRHDRLYRHIDHDASLQDGFLFDAWISRPCLPGHTPKSWEDRLIDLLDSVVEPHDKIGREYYRRLPFPMAVLGARMEEQGKQVRLRRSAASTDRVRHVP
ncbi:hypothetical protein ABZX28_26220 [Streptomyces rubiginosohelvolus]|uniref:hypothetical protein n=1 Tax=Streptomyces rubiginosohelvolus TaxID=67362 RepID=UPI0033AA971D